VKVDAHRVRGGSGEADPGPLCEEGCEVAADDLRWRPPKRVGLHCRGRAAPACEPGAQEARLSAGQQEPAQNGIERLRREVGAGRGGDRLRRGIRLLGCEATLLDRKIGGITGGEDVGGSADTAAAVDRDEAAVVVG
jgi:hypothetical protein